FVDDVGENIEIVVVDDDMDLSSKRRKHAFNNAVYLFDVTVVSDDVTFEIDEELVLLRMKGESLLEWHAQQVVAQSHRPGQEYALIHDRRITADNRLEIHLRQDFALGVRAWSNLHQRKPGRRKPQKTASRPVKTRAVPTSS